MALLFITSLGLLFVMEGILPFLSPTFWRQTMLQMCQQNNRTIRIVGLVSMLMGLALIVLAHNLF